VKQFPIADTIERFTKINKACKSMATSMRIIVNSHNITKCAIVTSGQTNGGICYLEWWWWGRVRVRVD